MNTIINDKVPFIFLLMGRGGLDFFVFFVFSFTFEYLLIELLLLGK